jgi:phosphatidylinositol glycan class S
VRLLALFPFAVVQGLSHCFVKEEGKLGDQFVIEPITANSLECMAKGGCAAPPPAAWWREWQRRHPGLPGPPTSAGSAADTCRTPPSHLPAGAKTSFTHVFSLRLGEALQRSKAVYPPEFADAAFCENYEARCDACARTWMRPHPMDNLL